MNSDNIRFKNCVEHFSELILTELTTANLPIKVWIAGGCLRDYFSGKVSRSDIDLFFPTFEDYNRANWYFRTNGEFIFENENSTRFKYKKRDFDLIKKIFFQSPVDTINDFDFTVCMLACDTENIYYGENTFLDLAKRQLMLNKILFPPSTMKRAFKYYQKGYSMCIGEMFKLVEAIQNMPKLEQTESTETQEENIADAMSQSSSIFNGID